MVIIITLYICIPVIPFVTHCGPVTSYGDIDQGHNFSGDDLFPDCSVAFTWEQFTTSVQATTLYNGFENYAFDIIFTSLMGQWVQLAIIMTNIQYNPKYAHGLLFLAICCGLRAVYFTHISRD